MASSLGPDPGDAGFFADYHAHADPPTAKSRRHLADGSWGLESTIRVPYDSEEEEIVTPPTRTFTSAPASSQVLLTQDQWTMVNNIQNIRITLSTLEAHALRNKCTVAHSLVLMRWQYAHLGPGIGHADVPLWHEATNLLRGHVRDNTVILAATSSTRSR